MKKKILLIEDQLDLIDNISILLEANNYNVISASNGKEGILKAKEQMPDLIICDIMMPGMDGYEVIQELNNDGRTSLIPFIFLTAKVEYNDVRKGMELGADDYLHKPFRAKDLITSVETRLKKYEKLQADTVENQPGIESKKYKAGDNILFRINNISNFVKVDRIKYIYADRQYTFVVLRKNKQIVLRKSLNYWEEVLPENLFLRIHRSTIINIEQVDRVEKNLENELNVFLKDIPDKFSVSRRFASELRNFLPQ